MTERPRILVVDDEPLVAKALVAMLKYGYDVTATLSGAEAMKLEPTAYDAVITDYAMPKMNGLQLLEWFREENPRCARILMSGNFSPEDVEISKSLLEAYLPKPFHLEDARDVIDRLIVEKRASFSEDRIVEREVFLDRLFAETRRSARHNHELSVLRLEISGAPASQAWWSALTHRLCEDARFRVRVSDTLGVDITKGLFVLLPETDPVGAEVKAKRMGEAIEDLALPESKGVSFTVTGFGGGAANEDGIFGALR